MGGKIGDISNLRKGKRITVGSLSDLSIVRKIGEGGSAFVYTARRSQWEAAQQPNSTSAPPLALPPVPAPISDSASVAGYNAAGSVFAPDDEDGASVMSYAPGDASHTSRRRRSRRASRLFSSKSFRHMTSSSSLSRADDKTGSSDLVVIKATSTPGSSSRRRQAEKEVEVLLRLRNRQHPNIVKIWDWASIKCSTSSNGLVTLCAMEYCSGGSLMDLISDRRERLLAERARKHKGDGGASPGLSTERDEAAAAAHGNGRKFLRKLRRHGGGDAFNDDDPPPPPPPPPQLIDEGGNAPSNQVCSTAYFDYEDILSIFQQVASALRFLHNSFDIRPLVHRDVKPENILLIPTNMNQMETILPGMHRWTVRLCDFGSVVEGAVPLRTPADRKAAEEIIQKSTTQMYRAPEMVDVHSVQELTAKSDTWALGCSLYMTCYLQNCFEENSSLAILSGKYIQPPDDHPYAHTPVHELIDRTLTVNVSRRADIDEVCKCFDRLLVGKGLTKRPSGRRPKSSSSVATPRSSKTNGRRSGTSSRDSPPPPPPPPRPSKQKVRNQTQKQKTHLSDPIPSSVVVDRRPARTKERARAPLNEDDPLNDLLMGEQILMQAIPEETTAMRSHRDPRKNYNRRQQVTSISTSPSSICVDHIYEDLLCEEPTKRSRSKSKKKESTTKSFADIDDTELDRIRIFTSPDKIEMKAVGGSDTSSFDSPPPLTPIEMSSIASASSASEGHYSFSRESPARRTTRRDPTGVQGLASSRDPPGTRPLPTSYF